MITINTKRSANVDLALDNRLRRWSNNNLTFTERLLFSVIDVTCVWRGDDVTEGIPWCLKWVYLEYRN